MSSEMTGQPESPSATSPQPQLPAGPPTAVYARPPKSPGLALLLSLMFPGAGQIYNGQPAKAFLFFFGFFGAIYACATVDPLPFAFLIPFVFIYNMIDAWKSATAINARAAGGVVEEEEDGFESPAWGGGLVLLGTVLLLNNLGWLRLASLQRYWPVILIVAGAVFIYNSIRKRGEEAKEEE